MNANTTAHDMDIKMALDILTAIVYDEHELTNEALLDNLTAVVNQLGTVQSNIQSDIDDVEGSIDSLKDEDTGGKETQDATYSIVLLGVVLLVLILIILLIGMMILIKENKNLRRTLGKETHDLPSEEQTSELKEPEVSVEEKEADE
jgi:hypothetical protein